MVKPIPDQWLEYKPFGNVINGTKILPMKVPLKDALNTDLRRDKRFTPSMLLKELPRIKYIIDLTNTHRYYDPKEFTSVGVKCEKIMVTGHELPSESVVKEFIKTVDDFVSSSDKEDIVAVHCTHGINRTGYLICRYLEQRLGWDIEACLKAFEDARGYPIERDTYIRALKDRSHS